MPFSLPRKTLITIALWGAIVLAALLVFRNAEWRFYHNLCRLPVGCDPFGYLQQAEAIRTGREFAEHTEKPFLAPLARDLAASFPHQEDWIWPIAPHAYRFNPETGRLVNQYPPGTSLLLSLFPRETRALHFTVLVCAPLLCLLFFFRKDGGWLLATRAAFLLLFVSLGFVLKPFSVEYRSVNSVAPGFVLLLAAGFFLRKKPFVSLALLSAGILIRIPHAWLLPFAALPCLFPEWFAGHRHAGIREVTFRGGKVLLTAFFCGFLWLLLFQYRVMGSPFETTYPPYDREFVSSGGLVDNLRFYFSPASGWMWVHLAALVLSWVAFRHRERRWFWWVLALFVWNYAFYAIHGIHVVYYPFASAILALGLILSGTENLSRRGLQIAFALLASAFAVVSILAWRPSHENAAAPVQAALRRWQTSLAEASVVWAQGSSGTVEYATGKAGFRIAWGSRPVRVEAMKWLYAHGYAQAFLIDDLEMNDSKAEEALAEMRDSGVPFTVVNDAQLGRIGWMRPER